METAFKADLPAIAAFLEGLEESIIYKLLDRAQFSRNHAAYRPASSGFAAWPHLSLLEVRLRMQEEMDARFGRFLIPEERPFTSSLPASERVMTPRVSFPVDDPACISQNRPMYRAYMELLDRICQEGDDGQYGSSVEHDVFALQAIARRIHYGSFHVAEAKYTAEPAKYAALVAAGDDGGLMAALTRKEVEERILQRVRRKVDELQSLVNPLVRRTIDAELVLGFYRDTVIPLTKAGELAYLKHRHPGV